MCYARSPTKDVSKIKVQENKTVGTFLTFAIFHDDDENTFLNVRSLVRDDVGMVQMPQ